MAHSKIIIKVGGRDLTFETGKVARQANGAVWVSQEETVVFATACAAKTAKTDIDFLPLTVNYLAKSSAAGRTLSGYIKREGRPNEADTLMSRLIDRPLRPLFADGYHNETQVLVYVLSYDLTHQPDMMGLCAASAALTISDIPFKKPVGGVRVGMIDDKFIINPTVQEMEKSKLDLLLAGTEDAIMMIEGYSDFLTEDQLLDAIEQGHAAIKEICHGLTKWREEIGKAKMEADLKTLPESLMGEVETIAAAKLAPVLRVTDKQARDEQVGVIHAEVLAQLAPEGAEAKYPKTDIAKAFKKLNARIMRNMVVNEGLRCDGRRTDEVRKISIEQGILPRVHGSSLFTRGETQSLSVCTLGGDTMAQRYEDLHGDGNRRFYLQYFFPPFSVGEVGRMGPAGRREVGHGKLAERALEPTLPSKESFPYVLRLESNITESNGSSSMASICGCCLAMMEAGVPIKRPVAGIAMGLVLEGGKHTILSDILGVEDALGDMDFKVAGDRDGITAFQMDIKVEGITIDIMRAALTQAKSGRIHILERMLEACPTHKQDLAAHAPRIETVKIHPSKIGTVIGPGGKMIRSIVEQTGAEINIDDAGLISIACSTAEGMEKAKGIIHGLTADIEVGAVYDGRVTSVVDFGLFIEILPGKEGLCHISEIAHEPIRNIRGFIKEGEQLKVKVLDINERGQVKLSRRVLLEKEG